MIYYLVGDKETFPNMRLLLWNQYEEFDPKNYGKLRLHGQLELRVDDWVDFASDGSHYDNRVVEMGWLFKDNNRTSTKYDGIKAKFLYNSTYNNNPKQLAFQRIVQLHDMHAGRLDPNKDEPISLGRDRADSHWELVRYRTKRECLKPG